MGESGRCLGASLVITLEVAEDSIGRGVELPREGVVRRERKGRGHRWNL